MRRVSRIRVLASHASSIFQRYRRETFTKVPSSLQRHDCTLYYLIVQYFTTLIVFLFAIDCKIDKEECIRPNLRRSRVRTTNGNSSVSRITPETRRSIRCFREAFSRFRLPRDSRTFDRGATSDSKTWQTGIFYTSERSRLSSTEKP